MHLQWSTLIADITYSYVSILCTFLFSWNHFNMGIWEEEVEVHWDICAQILKKRFLLAEIKQAHTHTKKKHSQ